MPEKSCFVIAPIGEPESEGRKRSDQILKHVICPAAVECGYIATRADQISEPGMITSQVIQHVVDDPLVIADLTERNPNVFYELAIRHAIRKPLVQLIKKGEQIPFDVAGTRTIHVDHQDLDSVEEAKTEIVAQIRSLETDSSTLETPISVSLDLQLLRQSDNPEQRSLADVLSVISELRTTLAGVEKRLESPEALFPVEYLRLVLGEAGPRSGRERRSMLRMRHLMKEIAEMLHSEKPIGAKSRADVEERLASLRREFDLMIHTGDW